MTTADLKNKRVYIAIPYSHEDPAVIEKRMEIFADCDTVLINQGLLTMSPVQKHYSAVKRGLPGSWEFWENYSKKWLEVSNAMIVLTVEGWMKSTGVKAEIEFCAKHRIPVLYLNPSEIMMQGFDINEVLPYFMAPNSNTWLR